MPEDLEELAGPEPAAPRDISTWPLIFGTVAVLALAVVMTIAAGRWRPTMTRPGQEPGARSACR